MDQSCEVDEGKEDERRAENEKIGRAGGRDEEEEAVEGKEDVGYKAI